MRYGKDSSEPCQQCHSPVWISQVVISYTEAERMFWFVSGICKSCQRRG